MSPEFWELQVDNMRDIYLPASRTYVFQGDGEVRGFYSLYEGILAGDLLEPAASRLWHRETAHATCQA